MTEALTTAFGGDETGKHIAMMAFRGRSRKPEEDMQLFAYNLEALLSRAMLFVTNGNETKRVVCTDDERTSIMRACHEGVSTSKEARALGGHFGRDETYQKVNQSYCWKTPPLHSIAIEPEVWKQVGIDLIGPLPVTTKGNKYIVTLSDYFSKWPEAQALPDTTALGVAEFLYKVQLTIHSIFFSL